MKKLVSALAMCLALSLSSFAQHTGGGGGASGNTTSGTLTTNTIPKATGVHTIGDSSVSDNGTNVTTTENVTVPFLTFKFTPPPQTASSNVTVSGTPGAVTYYYWVVTINPFTAGPLAGTALGNSAPFGPAQVTTAPATLNGSNFDVVTWSAVPASIYCTNNSCPATTYDILRTNTNVAPTGACNCAVATAQSGTTVNDQSNSLNAYTVNTYTAGSGDLQLVNPGEFSDRLGDLMCTTASCDVLIHGGNGVVGTSSGVGGEAGLRGGQGAAATSNGTTGGNGGALDLVTGNAGFSSVAGAGANVGGNGGSMFIFGGLAGDATNGGTNTGGNGGGITIQARTGGAGATTGGNGGGVVVNAGAGGAGPAGAGGTAQLAGGSGSNTGSGGAGGFARVIAGVGQGDGTVGRAGGALTLTAGNSVGNATGAAANITSGNAGDNNATGSVTGNNGGAINVTTGAGGTANEATTASTGGNAGTVTVAANTGGAATITGTGTNTGGNGGAALLSAGSGGGATGNTSGTNTGGNGGAAQVTAGNGGNATTGTGTKNGGNGANVVIAAGAGGTGASANGSAGVIQFKTSTGTAAAQTSAQLGVNEFDIGPADTANNGILGLKGKTSGTATFTAPAVAGTTTNAVVSSNVLNLPAGAVGNTALSIGNVNSGFYAGPGVGTVYSAAGGDSTGFAAGEVRMLSSGRFTWCPSTTMNCTIDTGLSRGGDPGFVDVGTGAQGSKTGILESGNKVFVGTSDFTSANSASLQAITGLTYGLGSTARNMSFHCSLMYSQATNVSGDQFGVGVITTAPTNVNVFGTAYTNTGAASPVSTGVLNGLASTTPTAVVTFQPAVTTVLGATLDGTVETAGGGAATFNIYVLNGTAADVIVVKRGSYCQIF